MRMKYKKKVSYVITLIISLVFANYSFGNKSNILSRVENIQKNLEENNITTRQEFRLSQYWNNYWNNWNNWQDWYNWLNY